MCRHQKVADDHLRYFKDDWISLKAIKRFPNTDKNSVPQEKILKKAPARPNISKNCRLDTLRKSVIWKALTQYFWG